MPETDQLYHLVKPIDEGLASEANHQPEITEVPAEGLRSHINQLGQKAINHMRSGLEQINHRVATYGAIGASALGGGISLAAAETPGSASASSLPRHSAAYRKGCEGAALYRYNAPNVGAKFRSGHQRKQVITEELIGFITSGSSALNTCIAGVDGVRTVQEYYIYYTGRGKHRTPHRDSKIHTIYKGNDDIYIRPHILQTFHSYKCGHDWAIVTRSNWKDAVTGKTSRWTSTVNGSGPPTYAIDKRDAHPC